MNDGTPMTSEDSEGRALRKPDVMADPNRAIRAVPWSVEDWMDFHDSIEAFKRRFVERRHGREMPIRILASAEADAVEVELRKLEADPATTVTQMRLFMQSPMPCGHAVGNLLTCPTPPYGCVICWQTETRGETPEEQ